MALSIPGITGFRRKVAHEYQRSSVVLSFNQDGLELARVKTGRRWLPIWHIIFFIYVAMLIRLVVMADMGPSGYNQRIEQLKGGNAIERAAAVVMEMDPVSRALATQIRSGLGFMNTQVFNRETWSGGV